MATQPIPARSPGLYDLDKTLIDRQFLDGTGALSVSVKGETSAAALDKIRTNATIGGEELVVADVQATGSASANAIRFLNGPMPVSFNAEGSVYARLGIYPDPKSDSFAHATLPIQDTKFSLAMEPERSVAMVCWGADAKASANGSMALGGVSGTLDFSVDGTGEAFFAVLQQVSREAHIDDALRAVVHNWKLPVHVQSADDLAPRTHVIAEAGGSLSVGVSAMVGHTFNWMRPVSGGGIAGDIGLKLALGLEASLELKTQGKFAVVVSRETEDPMIRVRIFKLRANGFDFALSASAAATGEDPLPASYDDLVQATLGVHALQILKELEDPNAIQNWITQCGPQYVQELLKRFTGLDLDAALTKISNFAQRWTNLPSTVSSLFVKMAQKSIPDFSDIRQLAEILANKDKDALKTLLQAKLGAVDFNFLSSSMAQYVEGIGEDGILSLLNFVPDDVSQAAQQTLRFLDGEPVEELLNKIVSEIDARLGVGAILQTIEGDPATVMDKLLFNKLADFIGHAPAIQDIKQIQNAIADLQKRAGELFDKTKKALESTYTAKLSALYEQTTTDTALVDATFQFRAGDESAEALRDLLAGRITDCLVTPKAGVTLNSGALTHGLNRHSHVDLTLPFVTLEQDWMTKSIAQFNAVDENNGRLTTYELHATGTQIEKSTWTSLWKSRHWRSTSVEVAAHVASALPPSPGFRVFNAAGRRSASGATSIRLEATNLSQAQMEANVEPFAVMFLPKAFPDAAAFHRWAATGHLLERPGNTLLSMDIQIPGAAPLAWLNNRETDKNAEQYNTLSKVLQSLLKRYLVTYYFRDVQNYEPFPTACLLLLYAAIPPSNAFPLGNKPFVRDIYWEIQDPDYVSAMIEQARSSGAFHDQLSRAQRQILAAGRKDLAHFDPDRDFNSCLNAALGVGIPNLQMWLLGAEQNLVYNAREAAMAAADFNQRCDNRQPKEALQALVRFGDRITTAFNRDLGSIFLKDTDALQRLSPVLFSLAAKVFDPNVTAAQFDATLNVAVLKPGVALPDGFPDAKIDPKDAAQVMSAASFGIA